ncbi:MAG: adenylate/guanylate cyclase domain-containing protein [Cyanobacteriota bacterium]|nr:adenylate/guanylate cyclase domain-containing protein [Cyanobacteriota bacterium]
MSEHDAEQEGVEASAPRLPASSAYPHNITPIRGIRGITSQPSRMTVEPCRGCGTLNSGDHNFCYHCGQALRSAPCPQCGTQTPIDHLICNSCGFPSEKAQGPIHPEYTDERKSITAFFADIKGSVQLLSERDIEEARHVIDSVILQISSQIRKHKGTVIDTVGDGVFAIFGAPHSFDGHPRAAINAALELQELMAANQAKDSSYEGVQLRIGIHTGEVIWRVLQVGNEMRHLPVGQSVNQASRLQSVAEPGSILIGASTYQLTKDYFNFTQVSGLQFKGLPDSMDGYLVLSHSNVVRNLQVSISRGLSPFVGRAYELKLLSDAIQQLQSGQGKAMLLVSEAGGGKSRLLHEATKTLPQSHKVVEAFCISYLQSTPWYSAIQLLLQLVDVSAGMTMEESKRSITGKLTALDPSLGRDAQSLLQFLDLDEKTLLSTETDPMARKSKYLNLFQRVIGFLAKINPLVIIIEDLHWLDQQSADVLDVILSAQADHPILLLCTTRPEGIRDGWWQKFSSFVQIDNLNEDATRQLITSLVPVGALSENLLMKIQNKTDGNPFFIEEIIRSLFSDDSTTLSGKEQAVASMKIPYSIQMALAERIDRLPKNFKQYLQILSVVGMKCKASLFARLISMRFRVAMEILTELQDLGFVFISQSEDQPIAQFVHVLTQEVAYSTLLTDRRASLHESIADIMKAESGVRLQDLLPELAHHYSQSRNDLKALEYLRLAGESAIQRSANQEAQNYLRLGLARLEKAPQLASSFSHLSHLWLSLGVSLQVTLGYAAAEVKTAYENAVYYSKKANASENLLAALRGYGIFNIVRGNYVEAARIADQLKAFSHGNQAFALEHLILHGLSSSYMGDLKTGARYYQEGLLLSVGPTPSSTIQYSGYSRSICYSYHALNALFAGHLDLALEHAHKGLEVAVASGIPIAIAQSRGMQANVLFSLCEFSQAEKQHQENIAFADENGFVYWSLLGRLLTIWTKGYLTKDASSLDEFSTYLAAYRGSGALIGVPWFLNLYAELLWDFHHQHKAFAVLQEAEEIASQTQERFFLVDTLRLRGEFHSASTQPSEHAEAIHCFDTALHLAQAQGTWLLGMRAAVQLARLLQRKGDRDNARQIASFYYQKVSWMTCPDHDAAQDLLAELFPIP